VKDRAHMRAGYAAPLRPRISIKTSNFILKFAVAPIVHVPCHRRACLRSGVISPASSLASLSLPLSLFPCDTAFRDPGFCRFRDTIGGSEGNSENALSERSCESESFSGIDDSSLDGAAPRDDDRRDVRGKSCVGKGTAARRKTVCQEVVN